jgi:hypothetical protein
MPPQDCIRIVRGRQVVGPTSPENHAVGGPPNTVQEMRNSISTMTGDVCCVRLRHIDNIPCSRGVSPIPLQDLH